jgi:glutamate dehydrogenase
LHNEIVCTQVANNIVDRMGMTFVNRLVEFVGCTSLEAVQAYWAVQLMFDFDEQWAAVQSLSLNATHQLELLLEIIRLGRRATRWLIRNNRGNLQPAALLQRFAAPVRSLLETAPGSFMSPVQRAAFDEASMQLEKAGLPSYVARKHAHVTRLLIALPVVEVAQRTHQTALEVIPIFAEMGVLLATDSLVAQLDELDGDHWQAMERDALLDDVLTQQLELTARAINTQLTPTQWATKNSAFINDWQRVLADLRPGGSTSITLYSMTVRKLGDLTKQLEA